MSMFEYTVTIIIVSVITNITQARKFPITVPLVLHLS